MRKGKGKEIERLFRSNYQAMHTLASRLLRDEDAARDIVHDVHSAIHSMHSHLPKPSPAWLTSIPT